MSGKYGRLAQFPEDLQTARLRLRRFTAHDAGWYAAVNANPEVVRYIGGGAPLTRAESDESLTKIIGQWDADGFGLWAAERLDSGEPIGFIGLAVPTFLPEILPAVEVGWRLARVHWGRGFATEGAVVAVDHGFQTLRLDRIVSITVHDNAASRNVMSKLGLTWDRACVHPAGLIVEVRALDRHAWPTAALSFREPEPELAAHHHVGSAGQGPDVG